jgi:uncharacterized protein YjbI with pentapeptide repeats
MIRWLQNLSERTVLIILVLVAVFSLGFSALSHWLDGETHWWGWADSAFQNFSTEMMGAVLTFAMFELVVGERNEKRNLFVQLRSKDQRTSLNALELVRERGWDKDGMLNEADLSEVNLPWVDLSESNLQKTKLLRANLVGSQFSKANMQEAVLDNANLTETYMFQANLRKASLQNAFLREAYLSEANLQGANLSNANLAEANLQEANLLGAILINTVFDERTVLPDAQLIENPPVPTMNYTHYWTPLTDMRRYTDPKHPNFWAPDWFKKLDQYDEFE